MQLKYWFLIAGTFFTISCTPLIKPAKPLRIPIIQLQLKGTPGFWERIKVFLTKSEIAVFSDNGLIYVAMQDCVKMFPFVRDKNEWFRQTAKRQSREKQFRVVINGAFYALNTIGMLDAFWGSDPVHPAHTTPQGLIIKDGHIIGGRPAPLMFFVANDPAETQYRFGFGRAPENTRAAIGGCGPLIINGLPYGANNIFRNGIQGKLFGEPEPGQRQYLLQRSNRTFESAAQYLPNTGKTMIAHHSIQRILLILVLPHRTQGISLPEIRDKLRSARFDNAVFLDGGDSTLLFINGQYIIKADSDKDETNTVGIGFKY